MNIRLLSALLVFLLIASVSIPSVSAEPSQAYYELHNLCLCNAKEDLGHIPYLNWGIGYKAWIDDKQTDNWKVFVHAGSANKEFVITPETPMSKLTTLRNFIDNVDKCREEIEPISTNILEALASGILASSAFVAGGFSDNASVAVAGMMVDEVRQFTTHFNNSKNAQKNAEKLFGEL